MPNVTVTTPATGPRSPTIVFYDGECGLCHGFVRFALQRDRANGVFRFAPIGGQAFRNRIPAQDLAELPDSIVVQTERGERLTRSAAIFHILNRSGGLWKLLARIGALLPQRLSDFVYDLVASVRKKLFRKPEGVCPLIPAELRDRFLLD